MDQHKEKIRDFAKKQGFDLVGFTGINLPPKSKQQYCKWLDQNFQADMQYMQKKEPRLHPQKLLPKAQTVICLAMNYYYDQSDLKKGYARIARYAYGRDYHKIIKKKLKQIIEFIEDLSPKSKNRGFVDSAPVLERTYAEQAGLGVVGKNSTLINPDFGSWIFLAEILTTLKLTPDQSNFNLKKDFSYCGACRKCIDSCPTKAIKAPGVVDANLCLSYHNIENRGPIPPKIKKILKKSKRLFGCDICQEVCPHNQKNAKPHTHKELKHPKIAGDQLSLKELKAIKTDQEFLKKFAGSPLMRAKRKGLQKNLSK